uniref:Uncharacterized protein n=1 Tax=Anguilla anguilla TaxID=7936 RepID=A0A0E9PXC4_ANGAN
MTLHSQDMFCS